MSDHTIYVFIFLIYFSHYTTSLQTPGNTMKTLKCKYVAIKAVLNVRLGIRLEREGRSLAPGPQLKLPRNREHPLRAGVSLLRLPEAQTSSRSSAVGSCSFRWVLKVLLDFSHGGVGWTRFLAGLLVCFHSPWVLSSGFRAS